jgi:hypothetical protein
MTGWIGMHIISMLSFDLIVLGSVLHTKQVERISQITSLSEHMAQSRCQLHVKMARRIG